MVQWKDYSPYEASWEPEEGILPRYVELFNRPSPDVAIVPQVAQALSQALSQWIIIEFVFDNYSPQVR